ncbi:MAG: YihY/virulence factor BrkB family protein [Muribaculaceae bacterium]|nr:YihY/virulence factor BrkB family protein [Muribaculaceae bacterium]
MDNNNVDNKTNKKPGLIERLTSTGKRWYTYSTSGVWSDMRHNWKVNLMKTVNLSVRSFLNADLQNRASALTYQTLLAIVPALALLFAICRGFGFQNLIESQLFTYFPAQQKALTAALHFVDSYLAQSSEGIFVGIGIIFLLWTLISLISNVEDAFDKIWGVTQGRTFWRKITDYTAIFLILPVLMICSSGITVFMSTTIQDNITLKFLSPVVSTLLDCSSLVLVWMFFAGSYLLIPNTKVKVKNAIIAGMLAGTGFLILQWLFVNGQIYVTKYNAIYGSFSFLPLLLIWLQLVWLITLSGAVYCYSSQNIYEFSFSNEISRISDDYRWRIIIAVMTITVSRYLKEEKPLGNHQIATQYALPVSLVTAATNRLIQCGLLMNVVQRQGSDAYAVAPAINPDTMTVGDVIRRVSSNGETDFIPGFKNRFSSLLTSLTVIRDDALSQADKILISSLTINDTPNENPDCN